MKDKWQDKTYHALESIRQLLAAEEHLVQYITHKEQNPALSEILSEIRKIRKQMETDVFE